MAGTAVYASSRSPLAEDPKRINSAFPIHEDTTATKPRHENPLTQNAPDVVRPNCPAAAQTNYVDRVAANANAVNQNANVANVLEDQKRLSQASYASSASRSSKNYKTHIGPWQLGKTLGKGSSARVRLCRHNVSGQLAAVKIVNRKMAYLVQDSSLAALSKWDNSLPEPDSGEMRVPMAIEREVAILKLIEHPNIMKLYDIWENRSEIYLILEYIDQGDLFTFINMKGRLSEEVSLYFFRQMISAITYCHSFNICHRDLKPENILITADLQIKIADFGMAALHQTANHQLATACGSPHYAAPELLKNRPYRGDRTDIWSMGVILYAMLSASLPFDDPDIRIMMGKTKKGLYSMPEGLSLEAEDLIRRMLRVNPDRRITLKEIWKHPLVQKYAYLDNYGATNGQPPDTRKGFQLSPVPLNDIDPQLLRQLRSMWHMFSEPDLKAKLTCTEANDQKAFYWLLHNYRDKQLEDFKPELVHSMSDYHHMKPGVWKTRISTCDFAQPRGNGHGRSISRFTVISTTAETEAGTVQSYDPYRGSRVLQPCESQISHAKVTVHRDYTQSGSGNQLAQGSRARSGSNAKRRQVANAKVANTTRLQSSTRGSLASLASSRAASVHSRGPSLRHKRGVDFTHVRKQSTSAGRSRRGSQRSQAAPTEDGTARPSEKPRSETPEVPRIPSGMLPKPTRKPCVGPSEMTELFNEELRHFSSNIAKDCDEAFKSSLIEESSIAGSLTDIEKSNRDITPFSFTFDGPGTATPATNFSGHSWGSRPLPPLPSDLQKDARSLAATPINSRPVSRDEVMAENDVATADVRLAHPVVISKYADRRIVSAPAYPQSHANNKKTGTLPSINETGVSNDKSRIVSAPPHTPNNKTHQRVHNADHLNNVEKSIRVVHSPSAEGPMKVPEPLNVRKVSSLAPPTASNKAAAASVEAQEDSTVDGHANDSHVGMKKKRSWFKRASKATSEDTRESTEWQDYNSSFATTTSAGPVKKKSFNLPFWKSNKAKDSKMAIAAPEENESEIKALTREAQDQSRASGQPKWHSSASGEIRNIEVKQNWLARLFPVKPATSHLCMAISRRRARQEVAGLLKSWREYGIRGIQADKRRNIVFARIGPKNILNLKEVHFAAEVMTVIEHGKKQPLSIIRFTQERGAASSFHKVVETIKTIFEDCNLLVTDEGKQKMMIKTLNAV